jgi:hypothetical protein
MDIFEQVAQMKIEEARQEGKQEGEMQTRASLVRELLAGSGFSDEKIAAFTQISVNEVAAIRKEMRGN